jgi:hypothetical protein
MDVKRGLLYSVEGTACTAAEGNTETEGDEKLSGSG